LIYVYQKRKENIVGYIYLKIVVLTIKSS